MFRLTVNTLINWRTEDVEQIVERVISISPDSTFLITIRLPLKNLTPLQRKMNRPLLRKCDELSSALTSGRASLLDEDPYAYLSRPDNEFSEAQLKARDQAWELISPLVDKIDFEFLIYPWKRGPIISELASQGNIRKAKLYECLWAYLYRGMIKNAFIADFHKCGGPGTRRIANEQGGTKLGRPSSLEKRDNQRIGIKITPHIEEVFMRGVKKFYETKEERTLQGTFDRITGAYFYRNFNVVDGELHPILLPPNERPTFRQFQYWYRKHYRNIEREKRARHGNSVFELKDRAVLGDSTQMAFGPGSVYQIDATIADVYLVSSLDPERIIGRPVIYTCMDVFSRLITGIAVTLEGPSWLGAMLALDNVTADKVAFCKEYGINIDESNWPCHHLPERILADRGEFEGYNADALVNPLNITLHNTPPYRADLKGIIEQNFRRTREKIIRFLPGEVYKKRQPRGARDYRLDATMSLYRFTRLMIRYVLWYNNHYYMKRYNMDEFMIQGHVKHYPLDLWEWGIRNRSGHLRTLQQDVMRLNLLPRKKVSITYFGIHFEKDLYYSCERALREQWFIRARDEGSWKIEIAYHPRCIDTIYLILEGGRILEPCHLTDRCETFKGRTWYETTDYFEYQNQEEQAARPRKQQSIAVLHAQQTHEISESEKELKAARVTTRRSSDRSRLKGIRENRQKEREIEQRKNTWRLGDRRDTHHPADSQAAPDKGVSQVEPDEEYVGPPQDTDKLQQIIDEVM